MDRYRHLTDEEQDAFAEFIQNAIRNKDISSEHDVRSVVNILMEQHGIPERALNLLKRSLPPGINFGLVVQVLYLLDLDLDEVAHAAGLDKALLENLKDPELRKYYPNQIKRIQEAEGKGPQQSSTNLS